ncbi:zinc finger MYM-type protein 1-like [Hydra vulgaris]|uniref:Zinc finger MYM-type protein 1-like n=1 Tax=Hydra vulgaris TaxID=6087 RepID=A0ABM4BNA8_HYDVU
MEHGPKQVNQFDFPKDSMQKKFSKNYYNCRPVDGDEVRRHWRQYSTRKKFEPQLRNNKIIDAEHLRLVKKEEQYWQQILKRLIPLVRVLGMQNLAFRGTHEKLNTADNGKFLKFVDFLALFDPLMDKHLRKIKIKDNETHVHYLGKDIQNELIHLLSDAIKQKTLISACDAKYFSIIIDYTHGAGHVEQMTMIICWMISNTENSNAATASIKEHFLDFVPLKKTTGAGMAETIIKQLGKMSLSIENLRGQGYDNGRNMMGKNKGVQRKILDVNP